MPRFLTNLSHEKVNIVKLFMRLNEFSSVRHINIARACREGYMPCLRKNVYINFLMRALVPLGEKSSESVPERVLPYRH